MPHAPNPSRVAIVGGGPAGLMAAEVLSAAGLGVDLFDAMPSVGRKFLLAGRGGLNLTHSEPLEAFLGRFGARRPQLEPMLRAFGPQALRDWAAGLGIETFVGSSGRVFPTDMKAAPLLRAWLHRLREAGVRFHARHRWLGWAGEGADPGLLRFATPQGEVEHRADAVLLALGGASWKRLGSDGAWVPWLEARGVPVAPLVPSNCGFDVAATPAALAARPAVAAGADPAPSAAAAEDDMPVPAANALAAPGWSAFFRERHAGQPVKPVVASFTDAGGRTERRQGEFVVTETGIEGSLVYAFSALLRDEIARSGSATLHLDLLPDRTPERVLAEVAHPRGARSLASHLKSRLNLGGVKAALLHEVLDREALRDPARVAATLKRLPLVLAAPRPIDEAISTAGGVPFEALDAVLMLRALPGVFCAGEMLDWEAPTGGYLLTACMASGRTAGEGMRDRLLART